MKKKKNQGFILCKLLWSVMEGEWPLGGKNKIVRKTMKRGKYKKLRKVT